MPDIFRQRLSGERRTVVSPTEGLDGLEELKARPWQRPMDGQDRVCTNGRRVLFQWSIGPNWPAVFRFDSQASAPSSTVEADHGRGHFTLTPGCRPHVQVTYIPGGEADRNDTLQTEGSEFAALRFQTTWTDETGGIESNDQTLTLDTVSEDDFDEIEADKNMPSELRVAELRLEPGVDETDEDELARWTRSPQVELTMTALGATRVVDIIVYEEPWSVAFRTEPFSIYTHENWTSHIYSLGRVGSIFPQKTDAPQTLKVEGVAPILNPVGGTVKTIEVGRAQRDKFGPMLWSYTSYRETDINVPGNYGRRELRANSSTFQETNVFDAGSSEYDPNKRGFSLSCGGYGRGWKLNSGHLLGVEAGVVSLPVIFRVYCKVDSAGGNQGLRLRTSDHSWVDVEIAETLMWYEGYGRLEVGVDPYQQLIGQVFTRQTDTSSGIDIYDMVLHLAL